MTRRSLIFAPVAVAAVTAARAQLPPAQKQPAEAPWQSLFDGETLKAGPRLPSPATAPSLPAAAVITLGKGYLTRRHLRGSAISEDALRAETGRTARGGQ
jgi:hypothetical protein